MSCENLRPSQSQIHHHYECRSCGSEVEIESCFAAPSICHCGGIYQFSGESYPASPDDWAEERDDYYSEWHRRS